MLSEAERPIIVAGGGAADVGSGLADLAAHLDAPVFTTINGKGILPPGHRLALAGNLGMDAAQAELEASDVVLAIGTEFGETEMYPAARQIEIKGKLIRIDIDPLQIVNQLPADIAITADSALAVAALNDALGSAAGQARKGAERAAATRKKIAAKLWPACKTHVCRRLFAGRGGGKHARPPA